MSQRKDLFKDVSIYAVSAYSAQLLDIVNGVLIRRFLGAAQMGMWSFLQLFLIYAKHAGLGVTSATLRDIPYHLGKGEHEKAEEIKDLIFTFTIATALLAAMGVAIFALFYRPKTSTPLFVGLLVVAVLIVLQRVFNLFVTLLRAYKEFVFAGYLNVFSSISSIVFAVVLTYRYKIYGFFAGLILNFGLSIVIILWRTRHRFRLCFSWVKLRPLLEFGMAMVVLGILNSTLTNIDRMMVTKFLGFEQLGIYSVALMVNNFVYNFPTLLVAVFPPYFMEAYGKHDRVGDLEKVLLVPTLSLSFALAILIGFVWITVPWLVSVLLPDYSSGIPALRILTVGSFFMALTHSFTTFVITVRKHLILIPLTLGSIAFGFGLNALFLIKGGGLVGVALATGILYAAYFLSLSIFCLSHLFSWKGVLGALIRILGPFLYVIIAIGLLHRLVPGGGHLLGRVIMRSFVFVAMSTPLLFWAERETRIFTTARDVLFRKKTPPVGPIDRFTELEEESPDSVKP